MILFIVKDSKNILFFQSETGCFFKRFSADICAMKLILLSTYLYTVDIQVKLNSWRSFN